MRRHVARYIHRYVTIMYILHHCCIDVSRILNRENILYFMIIYIIISMTDFDRTIFLGEVPSPGATI